MKKDQRKEKWISDHRMTHDSTIDSDVKKPIKK